MTSIGTASVLESAIDVTKLDDGRPFVCFCGQDWYYHNRAHSDFQLMTRLARTRKVLLINSIGMRMPTPGKSAAFWSRVRRKVASMTKGLARPVEDLPDYWVLSPVLFPMYGSAIGRLTNARLVELQVRRAIKRAGIRDPHVFVTVPTALQIANKLDKASLIYNRSDKHSAFGEADTGLIEGLEDTLLETADLSLYVSRELMREETEKRRGKSLFLDHGVDLEVFQRVPEELQPEELRRIPHPRIGFFGGLDDYTVDFDLLEKLARELPNVSLVLVGRAMCSMERFARYDNVHWVDFKSYEEIPAWGSGFDVALMPWQRNEWIRHCNPIKLKEYLALGLDIVSTDFPEIEHYADCVRIGRDDDEFLQHVKLSLENGPLHTKEAQRQRVDTSTWDSRTTELIEAVSRLS
ncbi:MAG: glycosyltransferase [Planctomycetes bacterium]|nr:glycosyltransferase [Planctomycetota bacterium]